MCSVPSQYGHFSDADNRVSAVPSTVVVSDPQVAIPGPIMVGFVKFDVHQSTTQFILMLHGFV